MTTDGADRRTLNCILKVLESQLELLDLENEGIVAAHLDLAVQRLREKLYIAPDSKA